MSDTPQVNARLVQVRAAGGTDSWSGEGDGAEKWAGDIGVYWRERTRSAVSAGARVIFVERTLLVMRDEAIAWQVEDVAVIHTGGATVEAKVAGVGGTVAPAGAESVDTVTLTMADA